ncbi:hypothetical protein CMI47_10295 [Candidatus Pacearchaeota archaeon]|nr:hypothetical protein [Candidatus Pacearchaeota archaeon]|tara:strand:+ start:2208 stop:2459 length:252 start_codon:yes stop_codon:yes gene_type:complete
MPERSTEEIVESFVDRNAWNELSQIILLCRFIDEKSEKDPETKQDLIQYLEDQESEEDDMGQAQGWLDDDDILFIGGQDEDVD